MGVNKVNLNGETLMDLTGDTVAENNLLQGAIAHNAAGEQIVGNATIPTVGNGKITINQAGVKKGEFTVNQSEDTSVDLDGGSNISLTNNLLATVPGVSALDAAVGPVIQGQITELYDNINNLHGSKYIDTEFNFETLISKNEWGTFDVSYTADNDCFIVGSIASGAGSNAPTPTLNTGVKITLNNAYIGSVYSSASNSSVQTPVFYYLKAGNTIRFNVSSGNGKAWLYVYGAK